MLTRIIVFIQKLILALIANSIFAAHGYTNGVSWCGYNANQISDWEVNTNSQCRIDTSGAELVLIEAKKHFSISDNSWFIPESGRHPGATFRFCDGRKGRFLSGHNMLTTAKIQKICGQKEEGNYKLIEQQGASATLVCKNYQASRIQLESKEQSIECEIPKVLQVRTPHYKNPTSWYGTNEKDRVRRGISDSSQACTLEVDDPTYPEPLTLGFIWGTKACHQAQYFSSEHPCGWFANNNRKAGSKMSGFFSTPVLEDICTKSPDSEMVVTEKFPRLDKHKEELSFVQGSIGCREGNANYIKLSIKPLVGNLTEKTCTMPDQLIAK